jgi:penicillin-binding protein 1A
MIKMEVSMKFGENEILEREQKLFSTEHRFLNRLRLDALCFQLFLLLAILAVISVCLIGAFRGIVSSAPTVNEKQILTSSKTTILYDKDGNELQRLDGSGIRQNYVALDKISMAARNAFIAADDTEYYKHHGVDIRNFFYAFYPDSASAQYAGSRRTLTQKLIRNQIFVSDNNSSSTERIVQKIQEQYLAVQFESEVGKDKILEYYLNTLYFGGNRIGIGAAAEYYFDKKAQDLTISESAVLAALAQDPAVYDPVEQQKSNSNKRTEILSVMLNMETISEDEYEDALGDNIYISLQTANQKKNGTTEAKNYYVSAVISQVISDLKERAGYSATQAYHAVYQGGLKIYTCLDSEIQSICEKEVEAQRQRTGDRKKLQLSLVFMDQSTGKVKALIGGSQGEVPQTGGNRAVDYTRQPGSMLTPLSVWLPAIDTAGMTLGTVQDDCLYSYSENGHQQNTRDQNEYQGLVTTRDSILKHLESPAVQAMESFGIQTGYDYLKKLGFSTLVEKQEDMDGNVISDVSLSLASGNLVNGVSNLDLTAAYGVLANEGKSVKPIFYTKLVDKTGNILFKNEQKSSQLLETASAWLITNVLHEYIETGAGKAADLGIEKLPAAGYGASTKGNKDQWFTGYTPYYTAGIWCGYDDSGMITSDISCETLWKQIMKQVHSTKKIEKGSFKIPDDIVACSICTKCGKLAVEDLCSQALSGDTVRREYFVSGTQPTENCDCHVKYRVCKKSGKLATEKCPKSQVEERVYLIKEEQGITKDTPYVLTPKLRSSQCNIHK